MELELYRVDELLRTGLTNIVVESAEAGCVVHLASSYSILALICGIRIDQVLLDAVLR